MVFLGIVFKGRARARVQWRGQVHQVHKKAEVEQGLIPTSRAAWGCPQVAKAAGFSIQAGGGLVGTVGPCLYALDDWASQAERLR